MVRRTSLAAVVAFVTVIALSGCAGGPSEVKSEATPAGETASQGVDGGASAPSKADSTPSKADLDAGTPSKADLDAYVAAGRRQMKSFLPASYAKIYSAIRLKPKYPSGIKYIFVFRKFVDVSKATTQLERAEPVLKATFDTQIAPEMKSAGFAHPSATWTYLNPDGSTIWTVTES